jgi:hypothetical protein
MAGIVQKKKAPKNKANNCTPKKSRGKPSEYDSRYARQAYELCLLGFTDQQLADFFQVSLRTIHYWKGNYLTFKAAILHGRDGADRLVAKSAYQRAVGYTHTEEKIFCQDGKVTKVLTLKHYPPDPTAFIWWLKNRHRELWNDKIEVEHGVTKDIQEVMDYLKGRSLGLPSERRKERAA